MWAWLLALLLAGLPVGVARADGVGACAAWVARTGTPQTTAGVGPAMVLCRTGYLVSYNTEHRTPIWVLEELTAARFERNASRDDLPFVPDPGVPAEGTARTGDYARTGFDRGHMSPAADNSWLEQAMRESFYLSNIAPQHGPQMNRGIWKDLEQRTREWAVSRGKIMVVSGPVFGVMPPRINGVAVPEGFFKVLYDPVMRRALAFYFDNKAYADGNLEPNIRTVREIEAKTGITFFPELGPRARKMVTQTRAALWR